MTAIRKARDYDWSKHTPGQEAFRRHGPHVICMGGEDDYQTIGARTVVPRPGPGWLIRATCQERFCVEHVELVPPIRPAFPPGVCVYCGMPADTKDHILPRTWSGDSDRRRVVTVPACRECNSAIGEAYAPTVAERREIAHRYIRRRYAKYLKYVIRGQSDLDTMGHLMRTATIDARRKHEATMARLAWPTDPFYDARAFDTDGETL